MFSKVLEVLQSPCADPVLGTYPFMGSAWPVTLLILGYVLFVFKIGRSFMQHRKPYNVKNLMITYNLIQVVYNAVMFGVLVYFVFKLEDRSCMKHLPLDHPLKSIDQGISYAYTINKLLDLMDTVFFVLRKSYKQITVLHVYHHIMMSYVPFWVIHIYGSGGQYVVLGLCNSFVHVVMYFYYFISALYPELKGSIWWKKYITKLQLVQFIVLLLQSAYVLILNPSCEFPLALQYLQVVQASLMILMFGNFYRNAYCKPKPKLA